MTTDNLISFHVILLSVCINETGDIRIFRIPSTVNMLMPNQIVSRHVYSYIYLHSLNKQNI